MHSKNVAKPIDTSGLVGLVAWFGVLLKPYIPSCLLIGVCILLQVGLYVTYPLGFRTIFDTVIPFKNLDLLVKIMVGLLVLFVVCGLAAVAQARLASDVGSKVMRDLRARMFEQLNRLSSSYFMKVDSSDLLSRFSLEFASIEAAYVRALPALIECVLVVFGCLLTIAIVDWRIAIVTAILVPLSFISGKVLGPRVDGLIYQKIGFESGMLGVLQESLHSRPIIRALGTEKESIRKFAISNNNLMTASTGFGFYASLIPLSSLYGVNVILVTIVGAGAALVINGGLSIGSFFGCIGLLGSVAAGASSASSLYAVVMAASQKVRRVNDLITAEIEVNDRPDAIALPVFTSEIHFENVNFGYTKEFPILKDLTCTIKAGTSVALVGGSGSGKSTMVNLIMRFFDPSSGTLTIDGTDIRDATQESLRGQMGVVMQDAYLINASIAENILVGKLDATQEEVEEAARKAEIHDFICALPYGYSTLVGENGGFLSGGQRQRIAIARALIRNPSMLLLDEPTSALDPSTEASINHSIEQLARDRTVIMVTHRLNSVQRFDKIFVLDQGQIAEEGNHYELLEKRGLYSQMWDKQTGVSTAADGSVRVTPERLKSIPIFSKVNLDQLASIASNFILEDFEAGAVLMKQGDLSEKFYIIFRGSLDVLKVDSEGHESRIAILDEGDHFGEIAVIKNVPRSATVRARKKSTCLSLNRTHFMTLVQNNPELLEELDEYIKLRQ
jgi:ATP-binding cassette subfamily B protein